MAQTNTGIIIPLFRKIANGFQKIFISAENVMLKDNSTTIQDYVDGCEPELVTLASGVRLQRLGKLRILHIVDASSSSDGTIVNLEEKDRPSNYTFASAFVRGQTRGDYFISVTPTSSGTGKVGLFYGANVATSITGSYIGGNVVWIVD